MSDAISKSPSGVLSAVHVLEYPYTRAVGPVIGGFLTGLRERRIQGVRVGSGKVYVPPCEFDPETGESISELSTATVAVADWGIVTSWTWIAQPRASHPLDRPFAWALIRLDGADVAMLHVVDAGADSAMQTGMRVRAQWREERVGMITDIEFFVPDSSGVKS